MSGTTFLEKIYTEDREQMCRSIFRRLQQNTYNDNLDFVEMQQESYDLWWEVFEQLNKAFKKGVKFESHEHAVRTAYRMIPFIVKKFNHKKTLEKQISGFEGLRYLTTEDIYLRDYFRNRYSSKNPSHESLKAAMRERSKKRLEALKEDPIKYAEFRRKQNIKVAILRAKKGNKSWAEKLLREEGIKYDKVDNGIFENLPFKEAFEAKITRE